MSNIFSKLNSLSVEPFKELDDLAPRNWLELSHHSRIIAERYTDICWEAHDEIVRDRYPKNVLDDRFYQIPYSIALAGNPMVSCYQAATELVRTLQAIHIGAQVRHFDKRPDGWDIQGVNDRDLYDLAVSHACFTGVVTQVLRKEFYDYAQLCEELAGNNFMTVPMGKHWINGSAGTLEETLNVLRLKQLNLQAHHIPSYEALLSVSSDILPHPPHQFEVCYRPLLKRLERELSKDF